MMRIAVFGATGRTGRPLVELALERGHEIVAHVRSPDRLPVEDDRLEVVEGDAYTGEGVAEVVAGSDAVVNVLGQTGGSPDDLLTVSGDHILQAMREHEVDRLVTLVGAGVRKEGEQVPLAGRIMGALLRLLSDGVLADAEEHVRRVRESDLEWTVVRVPRMSEGSPTGDYRVGDIPLGFESIDRADVARCILDRLEGERYVREMPKVGQAE